MRQASLDRVVVVGAIALVTLLAWLYLVRMATDVAMSSAGGVGLAMTATPGMPEMAAMADPRAWDAATVLGLFAMWDVMMIGMMLPSATPLILLVVGTYRRRGGLQAHVRTAAFTMGYLLAWSAFSAGAAVLQAALHRAALLSPTMVAQSAWLSAAILVIAGVYQWLPLKDACLAHCRSPLHFLSTEWREDPMGAVIMGLRHGWFCVGCCWALMALLFAVGVMNLLWVAAIAIFVLMEKIAGAGRLVSRVAGAALVVWGVWVLSLGS